MTFCGIDIINVIYKIILSVYHHFLLPIKVFIIREKKVIKVVFVLSDLGKWKTESLFITMVRNPRFKPVIIVIPYNHYDNSKINLLINYIAKKKYNYHIIKKEQKISDIIKADIIFYQESYKNIIDKKYEFKNNFFSLFCYVGYGFHWSDNRWVLNQTLKNFCWHIYYENDIAMRNVSQFMTNKGRNCIITGLPMTELFLKPLSEYDDPWIKHHQKKKRIIWAPHHTINSENTFGYSTFLCYSEYMLKIAEKYKESIQIAFKPHPLLLTKLYKLWGKEKTDNYYSLWANGENTQLVLGEYVSLFMHSDAMIHDCGTFTVEYHYTKKPVLYLLNGEDHYKDLNEFGRIAFDLHYKSSCETDIETFIENVIHGKDDMKEMREKFYNDYLLPPNGMSASDNIIKAILG